MIEEDLWLITITDLEYQVSKNWKLIRLDIDSKSNMILHRI